MEERRHAALSGVWQLKQRRRMKEPSFVVASSV
jgi:hypothetical protein